MSSSDHREPVGAFVVKDGDQDRVIGGMGGLAGSCAGTHRREMLSMNCFIERAISPGPHSTWIGRFSAHCRISSSALTMQQEKSRAMLTTPDRLARVRVFRMLLTTPPDGSMVASATVEVRRRHDVGLISRSQGCPEQARISAAARSSSGDSTMAAPSPVCGRNSSR
jgi:hypothetical protein